MSVPVKMRIEYYPARKSIDFVLYELDGKIVQEKDDKLEKYAKDEKGSFVLNLHGNDFFDDIMHPFFARSSVPVSIKTTRDDYEDFKRLVESYNDKLGNEKIKLCELEKDDELPDMWQVFNNSKKWWKNVLVLLCKAYKEIASIPCEKPNTSAYIKDAANRIKSAAEKLNAKLGSIDDNKINLCFIGAYSSGKSTLINAILGYRILPVSMKSETAKMMRVTGVPSMESSFIEFKGKEKGSARICWDKDAKRLQISKCSLDEKIRGEIQAELNDCSGKELYKQLHNCLDKINKRGDIGDTVQIGFPIPLDGDVLQYTITDTPGSDSNYGSHKRTLDEALSKQENSIAILVIKPDGFEGSANNIILTELLKNRNEKQGYVDMEQSFFVINKMDSNKKDNYVLESGTLEGDGFSINLSDRKLFFVSGEIAYNIRARKNGIEDEDLEDWYRTNVPACYTSLNGKYYTHNHYGSSQFATKKMRDESNAKLEKAVKCNDDYTKYLVCSGVWSLEQEIARYGQRHAVSVKAVSLIKDIKDACESVSKMVKQTENETSGEAGLTAETDRVKGIISCIKEEFQTLPSDIRTQLGIDSSSFQEKLLDPVREILNDKLHRFLHLFKVNVEDNLTNSVLSEVSNLEREYEDKYILKRMAMLEDIRREFISKLLNEINGDDSLSDKVKTYLDTYNLPDIPMGLGNEVTTLFDEANVNDYDLLKNLAASLARGVEKYGTEDTDSPKEEETSKPAESRKKDEAKSLPVIKELATKPVVMGILEKAQRFQNIAQDGVMTAGKVIEETSRKVARKISPKLQELNKIIQPLQTRTIDKKDFIDNVMDFLNKRQEAFTRELEKDYERALDKLCEDISNEFSGNIAFYSYRAKAYMEEVVPAEKCDNCIKELSTAISAISKQLEKF